MTAPRVAVVILAGGSGTRMKSTLPKPLHLAAGLPMVEWVIRAGRAIDPDSITVVVGPALLAATRLEGVAVALQDEPRGTGDAVRVGISDLADVDWVIVLYADHPLVTGEQVDALLATATATGALVTVLTCHLADAAGYGRIERDAEGNPVRIVELVDDDPAVRAAGIEANSGIMAFQGAWLRDALDLLQPNQAKGEYFLTDLVAAAAATAQPGQPWPVATASGSPDLLVGVNDRVQLAETDRLLRQRIREGHMRSGVTLVGPETIFIDADCVIGEDTTVFPFSVLTNGARAGRGCVIGPGAILDGAVLGDGAKVVNSTVRGSSIGNGSDVGPYSLVRNGSGIEPGVHIGMTAEVKGSHVESGVAIGHFSYIGDATVGSGTNIGAGTVTCNFDGEGKFRTEIGANAFIGSDTLLVAPVTVGDGASTGAGSVVTKDVAPGTVVVGIPARPIRKRTPAPDAERGGK